MARPPLPTLGYQPKKNNPLGKVIGASLLLGLGAGAGYWWNKGKAPAAVEEAPHAAAAADKAAAAAEKAAAAAQQATAAAQQVIAAAPAVAGAAAPGAAVPALPAPAGAAPTAAAPADPLVTSGLQRASIQINGPLESSFVAAAGKEVGPALVQVVTRTLVWWARVPGDLRPADTLDVIYEPRANQEPIVHAVRFVSSKLGKTFRAYRFQPQGQPYARYYTHDGQELEERLERSPIEDYEQITSLLRDGRRHKGVDFRAPVGTPVFAPFNAVVTRKNWNWRSNGNCVELKEIGGQGRRALFLHLDALPKSLGAGDRFGAGQQVATSGNSGHSFAPHLHYQLEVGNDRVLDPFDSHRTYRRAIAAGLRPGLDTEVRRLDALLGQVVATSGSR